MLVGVVALLVRSVWWLFVCLLVGLSVGLSGCPFRCPSLVGFVGCFGRFVRGGLHTLMNSLTACFYTASTTHDQPEFSPKVLVGIFQKSVESSSSEVQ